LKIYVKHNTPYGPTEYPTAETQHHIQTQNMSLVFNS
jgi:hypothetical protein